MPEQEKNVFPPPKDLDFWELFEAFLDQGAGNDLIEGSPSAWTPSTLEAALDGSPDRRAIGYWLDRANIPTPENIRKLSIVASGGNHAIRKQWYDALISARRRLKQKEKDAKTKNQLETTAIVETSTHSSPMSSKRRSRKWHLLWPSVALAIALLAFVTLVLGTASERTPRVDEIRVCDAPYFDQDTKKCSKHVSVFVHGVDEVFLSFDLVDVPEGAPFERWWIRNGERVAGRTSFNDAAWPGYTFWRPGVLEIGQYVVRIVVGDTVFTQVFTVQPNGFDAVTIEN